MKEKTTTTMASLLRRGVVRMAYCLATVLAALLLPSNAMADDEAWVEYDSSAKTLTFKYGTKPDSFNEGVTAYALNTRYVTPSWETNVTSVVFDSSFDNARPTTCYMWFHDMPNLTEIVDIQYLHTDNVTNMMFMFNGCSGLTSLDVSHFNTENVENMNSMFEGCSGLTSLDVSHFNTEKVEGMNSMFQDCKKLTDINVKSFSTENVTDMSNMFYGCSGLTSLDVTGFNTTNVTDMRSMFEGCSGLTSLDVSHFNTENVEDMNSMFEGCSGLTTLDVTCFSTTNVTDMSSMFFGCIGLTSLDVSHFNTENAKDMNSMFSGCSGLTTLDVSCFSTSNVTNMASMFRECSSLTTLDVSHFSTANVTDMSRMFYNCSSLTTLDVSGFNTGNVKSMVYMFSGCSKLTKLDVSGFSTENVTSMNDMFHNCSLVTSLDVSGFNTSNVTSMSNMFYNCSSLTELDLSGFNTSNVTDMSGMFSGCGELTTIYANGNFATGNAGASTDVFTGCVKLKGTTAAYDSSKTGVDMANTEGYFTYKKAAPQPWAEYDSNTTTLTFKYGDKPSTFDTGVTAYDLNQTSMPGWYSNAGSITKVVFDASFDEARPSSGFDWFVYCRNLSQIDGMEYLHTENMNNMCSMFYYCQALTTIDLSRFNTENVTDMSDMFHGCKALTSLDLSSFNTEKVTSMSDMFDGCATLTSLDLSSFNTENVTNMTDMFDVCTSLTTIYVSDKFNTSNVTQSDYMFWKCTSLENYNASSTDKSMANYKTGYFKTYYKIGDMMCELSGENLNVAKLVLEDGEDFVTYAPFKATTASYSRLMTNNWGTLCLPFAVDAASVSDCKFYALSSVNSDMITLTQLGGTIAAGTPVFVYSENGLNISASEVDVVTAPAEGAQANGWQLVGSFTETEVPDDGYIISKNKFWLTSDLKKNGKATAVKTKGLRAWLKDGSEGSEARATSLSIFAEEDMDEETAIDAVEALTEGTAEIYDVQGRRTDRLQKGLNIVKTNGVTKKIMVK